MFFCSLQTGKLVYNLHYAQVGAHIVYIIYRVTNRKITTARDN